MVSGLIVGWILSLFGVDKLLVQGVNDMFGTKFTVPAYYVICAFIGFISTGGL